MSEQDTPSASAGSRALNRLQAARTRVRQRFARPEVRRRTGIGLLSVGALLMAWQGYAIVTQRGDLIGLEAPRDAGPAPVVATAAIAPSAVSAGGDPDALPAMPIAPRTADALATPPAPDVPDDQVMVTELPQDDPRPEITAVREMQATSDDGPCRVTVDAMGLAAAIVAVDITAPCDPGRRVDIIQTDLHVAVVLDADGRASVEMPALSAKPAVAVLVTDRDPVTIQTDAVDFTDYQRAVLQWQGPSGLELHAFENGADYGDEGHVSPETPRTIAHALSRNGGYLTQLGDPSLDDARAALVYTLPVERAAELSIEAVVTDANCEQTLTGTTIQTGPGQAAVTQEVTMTMPGCDTVGDFVVLGSLLRPFSSASN